MQIYKSASKTLLRLALILVALTLPLVVYAEGVKTVYINPANGEVSATEDAVHSIYLKYTEVGTDSFDFTNDYNYYVTDQYYDGPLTVPVNIDGRHLRSIGAYAFSNCKITAFTARTTLRDIGERAFSDCPNLKTFTCDSIVGTVRGYAFQSDSSLTNVPMVTGKFVGYGGQFDKCTSLPSSVKLYCSELTENPFFDCPNIKKIEYVRKCKFTDLGNTFSYCNFEEIIINQDLEIFPRLSSNCTRHVIVRGKIGRVDNLYCSNLESFECDSIGTVTYSAFSDSKLSTLPLVTEEISNSAFSGCTNLPDTITLHAKRIQYGPLVGTNLKKVIIDNDVKLGSGAFSDTTLESIVVNGKITELEYGALSNLPNLKEIKADSIGNIGANALQGDTLITSLPEVTGYVDKDALDDCPKVKYDKLRLGGELSINEILEAVPKDIKVLEINPKEDIIPYSFFSSLPHLESITFDKSISSFRGKRASTKGHDNLRHITVKGTVESIVMCAFENYNKLETFDCTSVETVGMKAFSNDTLLTTFPKITKVIGQSAFKYCASLPDSITIYVSNIEKHPFTGCGKVKTVHFMNNVKLDDGALNNFNDSEDPKLHSLPDFAPQKFIFEGDVDRIDATSNASGSGNFNIQHIDAIRYFEVKGNIHVIREAFNKNSQLEYFICNDVDSVDNSFCGNKHLRNIPVVTKDVNNSFNNCPNVKGDITTTAAEITGSYNDLPGVSRARVGKSLRSLSSSFAGKGDHDAPGKTHLLWLDMTDAVNLPLASFGSSTELSRSEDADGCFANINPCTLIYLPQGVDESKYHGDNFVNCNADGSRTSERLSLYEHGTTRDDSIHDHFENIYPFTAHSFHLGRSFNAGKCSTLFLPFALNEGDVKGIGKMYGYNNCVDDMVYFSPASTTRPGTGYIVVPEKSGEIIDSNHDVSVVVTDVDSNVYGRASVIGTYNHTVWSSDNEPTYGFVGERDNMEKLQLGTFAHLVTGAWLHPFRAYLKLSDSQGASAAKRLICMITDDTTGIKTVNDDSRKDGRTYNLAGQLVGDDYKGIVIVNGKKILKR